MFCLDSSEANRLVFSVQKKALRDVYYSFFVILGVSMNYLRNA